MIVFLTLLYVVILLIAVRFKLLPWNLWTKISPLIWMLFLLIVLFIPLQFYAPAGGVRVLKPTVEIIPNVNGEVIEVAVGPNARVKKGDVLFRIDPEPFEARVKELEAALAEAEQAVPQLKATLDAATAERELWQSEAKSKEEAFKTAAVSLSDLDKARASLQKARADEERARLAYASEIAGENTAVARTRAQLSGARYDLEQTVVRAPADGLATNVEALRPGARVVSLPLRQAMVFVDDSQAVLLAQIHQIHLRHVHAGQQAEATFMLYPGEVFRATVESVLPGTAQGQVTPSGQFLTPQRISPAPLLVRLKLDEEKAAERFPAGAVGTVAIYTGKFEMSYIIRRVMLRMEAWTNYVLPR